MQHARKRADALGSGRAAAAREAAPAPALWAPRREVAAGTGMLHPREVLGMQRAAGNRAIQRLLAEREAAAERKSAEGTASPVASPEASDGAPVSVQRKVGFELEMSVLTDVNHADPGYGVKVHQGRNFDIAVDHNTALKPMTEAAVLKRDRSGVEAPYTSIVELVTKPVDETAEDGIARFNEIANAVVLFAKNVRAKTQGFNHRVPLDEVVPTATAGAHVGLDTVHLQITNLQALDGNIQATVGVDVAQAPTLLRHMGTLDVPSPILQDVNKPIAQEQAKAASTAATVMTAWKKKYALDDTTENQSFANLEGIVSLAILYMRTAALWSHLSETLNDLQLIDAMTSKNFTPLLSHTDLGTLRGAALTPHEEIELLDDAKFRFLTAAMLIAGRKGLSFEVNQDLAMLKWGSGARIGPTPKVFTANVLAGQADGLTGAVLPVAKQMRPEPVGRRLPGDPVVEGRQPSVDEDDEPQDPIIEAEQVPDDMRRRGAVIEFRSLTNRLSGLQSTLGASKFPVNAWEVLMADVFYTIRELSMRSGDSPTYRTSRARRPG